MATAEEVQAYWRDREPSLGAGYADLLDVDLSTDDFIPGVPFHVDVGATGDVVYRSLDGATDVTRNFSGAGILGANGIPVRCVAVRRSGTTATNLVAGTLYPRRTID